MMMKRAFGRMLNTREAGEAAGLSGLFRLFS
jgi:hypothetical protein